MTTEPMRLSNAKVKTYRRCPKQYEFKYKLKLKRKRTGLPLKRGDWLHQLLMVHYDGHDWRERQKLLTAQFNKLFEEEREEYGDLPTETERIMTSYLMNYNKGDEGLRVIDSELDELVRLPTGDLFNFIIDLIVEDADGGLWLWDHKTVGRFMPADFMLLDAQLARYFWAAQKMGYTPLRGIVFNEIITKPPTIPEQLKNGRLTERTNLACDVYTYYREIKRLGQDPADYAKTLHRLKAQNERWFRRTPLPKDPPLTKRLMKEMLMTAREIKEAEKRDHFPRTPMKECTWDCDFLEPCMIQLMGGDISDVIKMKYTSNRREQD